MRFSSGYSILLALGLSFSSPGMAQAHVFHLTMDDLPNQPVHGLAHDSGVEFAFTINGQPSDDAGYAAGGPQTTTFIEDPSIEGNSTGILFVGFSEPVPFVQFGVARNVDTRSTTAVIEVFDADNVSTGVTNLGLIPMPMFAEGRFTYSGPPISRFTLSFAPQPAVGRFAFDNLRFGVIPEPGTGVLAAVIVGMLGTVRRARITGVKCRVMTVGPAGQAPPLNVLMDIMGSSMVKRIAALVLAVQSFAQLAHAKEWVEYEGGNGPGAGRHIVLVSGDEEYRSEEAMPQLGKILAQRHGFRCTVLFPINPEDGTIDPKNQTNIPGFEKVADADLLVLFLRYRELPDDEMQHLENHIHAGKPILGLRTSTHAFNYERRPDSPFARYGVRSSEWQGGFGQHVLGETWVSHHGQHGKESARGLVNGMHENHRVLRGVKDIWGPTDVYGVKHLPQDAKVLVYGQVLKGMSPDDPPSFEKSIMPMIWQRDYEAESGKTANILCSTIGSGPDLESEGLRRLFVNFCYWSLGLEVPAEANVDYVGEYKPTFFGFDRAKQGVRPADHELNF